jgi:hypothetical protein
MASLKGPESEREWIREGRCSGVLFFNRNATGKRAARAFVNGLKERTVDRDARISVKAFRTQLKAIKKWGRSAPVTCRRSPSPP